MPRNNKRGQEETTEPKVKRTRLSLTYDGKWARKLADDIREVKKDTDFQVKHWLRTKEGSPKATGSISERIVPPRATGWKSCPGMTLQEVPSTTSAPTEPPPTVPQVEPEATVSQTGNLPAVLAPPGPKTAIPDATPNRGLQLPLSALEIQTESSFVALKLQLPDITNNPWRNFEIRTNLRKSLTSMVKDTQAVLEYQAKMEAERGETSTPWEDFTVKAACRASMSNLVKDINAMMVYQVSLEKQHAIMEGYYTTLRKNSGGLLAQAARTSALAMALVCPPIHVVNGQVVKEPESKKAEV